MNDLANLIGSVGFPVAACCILLYQNSKQDDRYYEEIKELRTTVENNTTIIAKLATQLERMFGKKGKDDDGD